MTNDTARNANALASTFLFFATQKPTLKNKKELTSQCTTTDSNGHTQHDRKKTTKR